MKNIKKKAKKYLFYPVAVLLINCIEYRFYISIIDTIISQTLFPQHKPREELIFPFFFS